MRDLLRDVLTSTVTTIPILLCTFAAWVMAFGS